MDNLLFVKSPFSLTASKDVWACWAGREEVLETLKRLRSTYIRRTDSSLDLMWANLGAGKSHVLFHLAFLLLNSDQKDVKMIPLVVEMPEQVRTFLDLYRRILSGIPINDLAEALTALPNDNSYRELKQAGQALLHGGPMEKGIAWDWISGGRPHLNDLRRSTGIGHRIEEDSTATDMLCGILKAFALKNTRVIILVDEFQRLAVLKKTSRDALLSSLRSVFSRTPEYFSVLLATALRMEQNALDLLSPELRTLLGHRATLSLPEMSEGEAIEFVSARFAFFRPKGFATSFAPFAQDSISAIIEMIKSKGRPLIPREILQALSYCYDEFDDKAPEINADWCKETLRNLRWDDA